MRMRNVHDLHIDWQPRFGSGSRAMISLNYNTLAVDLNHRVPFHTGSNEFPL